VLALTEAVESVDELFWAPLKGQSEQGGERWMVVLDLKVPKVERLFLSEEVWFAEVGGVVDTLWSDVFRVKCGDQGFKETVLEGENRNVLSQVLYSGPWDGIERHISFRVCLYWLISEDERLSENLFI
jgi:hypothetical protein